MNDQNLLRISVLQRLVELAMNNATFRSIARDDLDAALRQYDFDLTERERVLVFRFRDALNEAGIDVFLKQAKGRDVTAILEDMRPEEIEAIVDMVQAETGEP